MNFYCFTCYNMKKLFLNKHRIQASYKIFSFVTIEKVVILAMQLFEIFFGREKDSLMKQPSNTLNDFLRSRTSTFM